MSGQPFISLFGLAGPAGAAGAAGPAGAQGAVGPAGGHLMPSLAGVNFWFPLGKETFSAADTDSALTANVIRAVPFILSKTRTVSEIGLTVNTLEVGGRVRIGIYTATVDFYPDALLLDGGELQTDTAGAKSLAGLAQVLTAGVLYFSAFTRNAGATATFRSFGVGNTPASRFFGRNTMNGAESGSLSVARAYAALPANYPAGATPQGNDALGVFVRFSA